MLSQNISEDNVTLVGPTSNANTVGRNVTHYPGRKYNSGRGTGIGSSRHNNRKHDWPNIFDFNLKEVKLVVLCSRDEGKDDAVLTF